MPRSGFKMFYLPTVLSLLLFISSIFATIIPPINGTEVELVNCAGPNGKVVAQRLVEILNLETVLSGNQDPFEKLLELKRHSPWIQNGCRVEITKTCRRRFFNISMLTQDYFFTLPCSYQSFQTFKVIMALDTHWISQANTNDRLLDIQLDYKLNGIQITVCNEVTHFFKNFINR